MRQGVSILAVFFTVATGVVATEPIPEPVPGTVPACTCAGARTTNGWCAAHAVGYIAGHPLEARLLWDTLDAHGVDAVVGMAVYTGTLRLPDP